MRYFFQAIAAATLIPTAPSSTHAIGAHSHMTSTVGWGLGADYVRRWHKFLCCTFVYYGEVRHIEDVICGWSLTWKRF